MAKKPAPKPPANKPNNNKPSNNKPSNNKPSNNKPSSSKPSAPKPPTTAPKPSNNKPAAAPKTQQNAPSLPSYQNDQGPAGNTAPTTSPLSYEDAQASRDSTANLRNPNRDATHWTNADYGKSFGMKDIKEWQERWGQGKNKKGERDGYRNNDIMKIAQAAYAGGHVKNVNKLNEYFGKMNSEYYNPDVRTGYIKGQSTSQTMYPWMGGGANPKRAFEWNGFGNGMTKHERKGIPGFGSGSYEKGAQWSLPTGFMNGFSPIPTAAPAAGGPEGVEPEAVAPEEVAPEELPPEESNPSMNQGGYGDDTTNWATSWRGAKGTRARAGRPGQGTGSMTNRGPAVNAKGVGVRF
jgi:hypothetical protein